MSSTQHTNELRIRVVDDRLTIQVRKTDGSIGGAGVVQHERTLSPNATAKFIECIEYSRNVRQDAPRNTGRAMKFVADFLSGKFDEDGRNIA